jgi:hypothetical protein
MALTIASANSLILTSSVSSTEDNSIKGKLGPGSKSKGQPTAKCNWLDVVVFSQHPDEQLGQVIRVDELSEGLACAGDNERCVIFYRFCEEISKENKCHKCLLLAR